MGILAGQFLRAQDLVPAAKDEDLYTLSLEELMNVPINSASKKDETLFDAPLSSHTITRAEIDRAGSTSIMEALRLAPGVIVREQTNGVYDIHIRGFDNVLRTSEEYTKSNYSTLVMIDNRPVFNHNLGGTFWEALPIDINDVERIEIIRGPSAPLFGPNAVTGVINIITKRVGENKTLVNANVQAGTPSTTIANVSVGKNFNKFSAIVSGNYQKRERFDDTYHFPTDGQFYTIDQLVSRVPAGQGIYAQYPDPKRALDKFGYNAFLDYKLNDHINFELSAGGQESKTQKIFVSNIFQGGLPFTDNRTETKYANLSGQVYGFSFRTSYVDGHDDLSYKATPSQYDYHVFDINVEYAISLGKIGSIVPGVSVQNAVYGDEKYKADGPTYLNGTDQSIETTSGFIRTDLKPSESFRIMAAVRVDKFSVPDDAYLAYEVATTYKLNEHNLVRAAVTRSNSGSFIANNYLNLIVPTQIPGQNFQRTGMTDLKLQRVQMVEIGYRSQLSKAFQLDIDIFRQKLTDMTALLTTNGAVIPGVGFVPTGQKFLNVPTSATQIGTSISINFVPSDKIQIKPFVTIQQTKTEMLPSSFLEPTLAASIGAPVTYSDSDHKNTPSVYGGYYLNYKITKAFALNLNGYVFGSQTQYDGSDPAATGESKIKGKLIFNAKASYAIGKASVFLNGRNLFNSDSREYFAGDQISGLYTIGASFTLN
jgi:iron complex outermembrane receptor protein